MNKTKYSIAITTGTIVGFGIIVLIAYFISRQPRPETGDVTMAFLYQTVGQFVNGIGQNDIRLGTTENGTTIDTYGFTVVDWAVGQSETQSYGDPVFSRLSDGSWAMTAWTSPDDTRGGGRLLYHESACPVIDDAAVTVIAPSTASGCQPVMSLTGGKTSQIFSAGDSNYVFHMIGGSIYLAKLSDATHSATDLETMCVLDTPVTSLDELDYGETTLVYDSAELLLSDTAMGQREDGTWVLFAKGIDANSGYSGSTIDELCARNIYRATSSDLINWSELEEVATQASVPEAVTANDGTILLYWQDFSEACATNNRQLGAVAPIAAAFEQAGDYDMSDKITISFPDEAFESDTTLHYATNANPVALPDAAAVAELMACIQD